MSHARISRRPASRPGLKVGKGAAADAKAMPAVANTPRRTLREKRIAHAPIRIYFPGLNRIEVFGKCCLKKAGGRAPGLCQVSERRLNMADIVDGTGQEHGLFAVP